VEGGGWKDGGSSPRQPYENLAAWQKAMDLVVTVYDASKRFPADERFALTDQIRRAVTSIPSNIAEGYGRESERSYLQFCLIAHGSLREVETQVRIARRLGYIDDGRLTELLRQCDDTGRPLRGLIGYLRKQTGVRGIQEESESPYDIDE